MKKKKFLLRAKDIRPLLQTHMGCIATDRITVDGEKAGVYKNPQGVCYVVNPRCPHLGCQLEWNPDEKSWDCPCHGSRFDYQGNLLDNPALENLEPLP